MNLLLGTVVDDEVYKEYREKRYEVNHNGKTDLIPLKTIELVANSKDYAEVMPEYQKACRQVVESVRTEIQNLYRKREGKREIMKHDTFDGYLDDIKKVFDDSVAKKEAAIKKIELAREQYRSSGMEGSASYVARRKAEILEAEDSFKDRLREIHDQAEEDLREVQKSFQEYLDNFFMPSGADIDEDDMKLFGALELTPEECEEIASRYTGNVTMLRIINDYMGKHKSLEKSSIRYQVRHILNTSKKKYADTLEQYAGIVLSTLNESERFIDAGKKKVTSVDAGARAAFQEIPIRP